MLTAALRSAVCVFALGCNDLSAEWESFSVAKSIGAAPKRSSSSGAVSLVRLASFDAFTLGDQSTQIRDVGLGVNGTLYVVDASSRQVVVLDTTGKLLRRIGRPGTGPGELLGPSQIVVWDSLIAVHDRRTGLVSVFDTTGDFKRSFALSGGRAVESFARGSSEADLLVTAPFRAIHQMRSLNTSRAGTERSLLEKPSSVNASVRNSDRAGLACAYKKDRLVFANPWIYELIRLSASGEVIGSTRLASSAYFPIKTPNAEAGVGPAAFALGLVCAAEYTLFGYLDRQKPHLYYDFFSPTGEFIDRIVYDRERDTLFPGYPADARSSLLVTYRNKPDVRISLFRVATRPMVSPNGDR